MAEEKQTEKMAEKSEVSKIDEDSGSKNENVETQIQGKSDSKEKTKEKDSKSKKEKIVKKDEAVACGRALHISKKQGVYICAFIKGKRIDNAIGDLEQVMKMKKAVPFKGEIPHRKGKGMMSGRYPVKAAEQFIKVLKALKGNTIVNGIDVDKAIIYHASASWAHRPTKSDRRLAKRTHITLKTKEIIKSGGKK